MAESTSQVSEFPSEWGPVRALRRSEYEQLIRAGAFAHERVELILGRLVDMSPIGPEHTFAVHRLYDALAGLLRGRAFVLTQFTFALSDETLPEPDVAVLPLQAGDYAHERPERALLLIEVADSSLARDLHLKADLYARHGVPEYWVVDLKAQVIRVHRALGNGRYTLITEHGRGETIAPEAFADAAVVIDEILPR